ncbi:MAG: hypothetical protein ACXVB9_09115 [Bdellovibrionota bacterium]
MNNVTTARIYMLFALMLLVFGWKICKTASVEIARAQAKQAAQLERMISANE